jgi:hypothetical protein
MAVKIILRELSLPDLDVEYNVSGIFVNQIIPFI